MHHVAIMNKSWKLIPKILTAEKTIESRWYQTKRTPWDRIKTNDTIYFKNAGEKIIAQADVEKVLQFAIHSLADVQKIIDDYGKGIAFVNPDPATWNKLPHYCILIFLKNPKEVLPFSIDKKGFGSATAWIAVEDIHKIKK